MREIANLPELRVCKNGHEFARGTPCRQCGRDASARHYYKNREAELLRAAEWRLKNPEKYKSSYEGWRLRNKSRCSSVCAAWHKNNSLKRKIQMKRWRLLNKDKIDQHSLRTRLKNKEIIAERIKAWNAKNPEKVRMHAINRRHRTLSAGGKLSRDIVRNLYILQRGLCPCCGQSLGDKFDVDHIVPISKGGANIDSNIQLMRRKCNNFKRAKDPIDFMQSRGFLL
jgi:5-methylcytosine-specific restriction endonuclease McrA